MIQEFERGIWEYGERYLWTGRERDRETGLQYNRARYYDPDTARWTSQDPLGMASGDYNWYRYVGNSPGNATDPSGLIAEGDEPGSPLTGDGFWEQLRERDEDAYEYLGRVRGAGVRAVAPSWYSWLLNKTTWVVDKEGDKRTIVVEILSNVTNAEGANIVLRQMYEWKDYQGWQRKKLGIPEPEETSSAIYPAPGTREYSLWQYEQHEARRRLMWARGDSWWHVAWVDACTPGTDLYNLKGPLSTLAFARGGVGLDQQLLGGQPQFAAMRGGRGNRGSGGVKGAREPGGIVPTETSPLPGSYINSRFTINMANAPAGSATNAAGFARNGPWFWRRMLNEHPKLFSRANARVIREGGAPVVDASWVRYNTAHQSFLGDTLIHHHIDQRGIATALPQRVHRAWHSVLHRQR